MVLKCQFEVYLGISDIKTIYYGFIMDETYILTFSFQQSLLAIYIKLLKYAHPLSFPNFLPIEPLTDFFR